MLFQEERKKACSCGTTLKDFLDTGLFGCENCYTVFEQELLPILQRVQGATVHYRVDRGEEKRQMTEQEERLALLRKRYRDYIDAGNFDDAERIAEFLCRQREETE